jgi:hypothetical protein
MIAHAFGMISVSAALGAPNSFTASASDEIISSG